MKILKPSFPKKSSRSLAYGFPTDWTSLVVCSTLVFLLVLYIDYNDKI